MNYKQTWNLDQALHRSSASYEKIDQELDRLLEKIDRFSFSWETLFDAYQSLLQEVWEAGSLIVCLTSMDVTDTKATKLEAKYQKISAALEHLSEKMDTQLGDLSEEAFQSLVQKFSKIAFVMEERRRLAKKKALFGKRAVSYRSFCFGTCFFYNALLYVSG